MKEQRRWVVVLLASLIFVFFVIGVQSALAATPLTSGEISCGDLDVSEVGIYEFYGEAGDRVLINAEKTDGGYYFNTEILLIDPSFEDEADTIPGGDLLDHVLLESGIYTVIVQDNGLDSSGSYCLSLLILLGAVASPDDCNGGLIGIGSSQSGESTVSDMDVYQFYGQTGDRVLINAEKTDGGYYYNTEILLIGPDNQTEVDTLPGGDLLDHNLLNSGLYKIVVQDNGLDAGGAYIITLNKLPNTVRPGIYNPNPATACDQPGDLTLTWDPVAGATGYDVYFGTDALAPLDLLCTNIPVSSCAVNDLEKSEVYYWMVVAHTPGGDIQGTVNWFATELPCDLNHDCSCNILDYQTFIQDWGSTTCGDPPGSGNPPNDCECDLDTNGKCNILDYQVFIQDWGRTICP